MKDVVLYAILVFFNTGHTFVVEQSEKVVLKTEKLKSGDKKVSIDMNLDGKADTFRMYHGDQLISEELQTKYNGKVDEWIKYSDYQSSKRPVIVKKSDTNGDGKVDRIESVYRHPELGKLITTIEADMDFNGAFEKTWTNITDLYQKKDQGEICSGSAISEAELLNNLYKNVNQASLKLNNGFVKTEQGYKIHQSCLENWGADVFNDLMKQSMEKGFQCLRKLSNDNVSRDPKAPNGAKKNITGLLSLLQITGISVVCAEKDYDWEGTAGHASAFSAEKMNDPKVDHPFISINPNYPKVKRTGTKVEKAELMKTLFHEQLHNLGILHNEASIEYPYTCETCCVPSPEDKQEAIDISCKICSGSYTSNKDKAYLKDFVEWGKISYQAERAQKAVMAYQKEHPKDRFGIMLFASASSGVFSPIGIEVAKILQKKFPDQTPEEKEILKVAIGNEYFEHNKKAAPYAKIAAEAHMAMYYEQDENKVLTYLENNKKMLREITNRRNSSSQDEKYVLDNVFDHLDRLIGDIWMKGYPKIDGPTNERAYAILKSTGFIK